MNRTNLVIAMALLLAPGCALWENPPAEPEPSAAAAAPAEPPPPAMANFAAPAKIEAVAARPLGADEVRRLQMRLREAGFDAGPADGIAGARTRAALGRYRTGCEKSRTLLDAFDPAGAPLKAAPDRQESQSIQLQLRRAGFDPGPADGIFGARTRKAIAQLKTNCPLFDEAAARLNDSAAPAEPSAARTRASAAPGAEMARAAAPQSREEIRILQLRLRDAGLDPGPFDGIMGPKTIAALQQYEAGERLKKTKASLRTTQGNGQY